VGIRTQLVVRNVVRCPIDSDSAGSRVIRPKKRYVKSWHEMISMQPTRQRVTSATKRPQTRNQHRSRTHRDRARDRHKHKHVHTQQQWTDATARGLSCTHLSNSFAVFHDSTKLSSSPLRQPRKKSEFTFKTTKKEEREFTFKTTRKEERVKVPVNIA
jgi:hypothetical protein